MNRYLVSALVLAALAALPAGPARAGDAGAASLEDALASARTTGRPVVLDFYTDW